MIAVSSARAGRVLDRRLPVWLKCCGRELDDRVGDVAGAGEEVEVLPVGEARRPAPSLGPGTVIVVGRTELDEACRALPPQLGERDRLVVERPRQPRGLGGQCVTETSVGHESGEDFGRPPLVPRRESPVYGRELVEQGGELVWRRVGRGGLGDDRIDEYRQRCSDVLGDRRQDRARLRSDPPARPRSRGLVLLL